MKISSVVANTSCILDTTCMDASFWGLGIVQNNFFWIQLHQFWKSSRNKTFVTFSMCPALLFCLQLSFENEPNNQYYMDPGFKHSKSSSSLPYPLTEWLTLPLLYAMKVLQTVWISFKKTLLRNEKEFLASTSLSIVNDNILQPH